MKRLILEMGSGNDLYGMNYTKAAIRALDIPHSDMQVKVTIGVQDPDQVDIAQLAAHIPRGQPDITVTFGGQNIKDPETDSCAVIASCAVEAFVPINPRDWVVRS